MTPATVPFRWRPLPGSLPDARDHSGQGDVLPPQDTVPEFHADSTVLARLYCPGCEPDADPFAEILDVHWCDAHMPPRDGSDDGTVASTIVVSGSAEAGGEGTDGGGEFFTAMLGVPRARGPRVGETGCGVDAYAARARWDCSQP